MTTLQRNGYYVWSIVFISAFLVQAILWRHIPLVDQLGWMQRIDALSRWQLEIFTLPTFANPDAAMLTVGSIAHRIGASVPASLQGSTALLNALMTASITTILFLLYPKKYIWIVGTLFIVFSNAYVESTPHDTILAPAFCALMLLALYLYQKTPSLLPLGSFAVIFGISLATFLPLAPILVVPILVFLYVMKKISGKQCAGIVIGAAITLALFDPLLWAMPIKHMQAIYGQLSMHSFALPNTLLSWEGFFTVAPFALLAILVSLISLLLARKRTDSLPTAFLIFSIILTIAVTISLLSVKYKTFRSFHSLIFFWDMLLPVLLLDILAPQIKKMWLKRLLFFTLLVTPMIAFIISLTKNFPSIFGL